MEEFMGLFLKEEPEEEHSDWYTLLKRFITI